jgi:hypothetical protein
MTSALLLLMWLLCIVSVLCIGIACIRGTRKPPRNRRVTLPPPSPKCMRVPDESTAYRVR